MRDFALGTAVPNTQNFGVPKSSIGYRWVLRSPNRKAPIARCLLVLLGTTWVLRSPVFGYGDWVLAPLRGPSSTQSTQSTVPMARQKGDRRRRSA